MGSWGLDPEDRGGRFEQFLEFAPDAIVGIGADGAIVVVNAQTEALFGYTRAQLLELKVEALVPERFRGVHPGHRSGYFADPRTRPMGAELELFGVRSDGTEFPAEISLSSIETDDGLLAIAAIRDITRRVQAERKFEQFLEFAPDAIVGVGGDGAIVVVNAQTEALFGYTRAQLLRMKVEALVPERFHPVHPGHRSGYFADPRTRPMGAELELFGVRNDGTEFPAEISLSSIETEDGLLAIAAIRDITERVEAQSTKEQLEAQVAEARRLEEARDREMLEAQLNQLRRLESVGQLAGGIAHDFNNILGVIINYAQFVEDDLPAGSPAADDVQEIRRAAERAAALTRQLLIFSRREVVRPQVLDLNVVVSELDKLLRRALGEHIELETRSFPEPVTIEADPGQIEQVLVNLAVNARDAMPSGGRLVIETSNVELDADTLRPELSPGWYARLTVSDTGTGMTREVAAHAFDPFFTTKPSGEGTGLGLATVYGIVTEAGGDVRLYSEPGVGTTVRVELPATARAPAVSERVKVERPAGRGETVLVVEDEDSVRRLVQRVLESAGYVVMVADRGAAALEILDAHPDVDLLLSDVVMPEMLGPELVSEANRRRPDLKILYMSGYIHQVIAGLDADTSDDFAFIEKPFTGETLRQAVRSALDVTASRTGG